jgi:hypothetical protein
MKPKINKTKFGTITISGTKYDYDVIIRLDGRVEKPKRSCPRRSTAPHTSSRWTKPLCM